MKRIVCYMIIAIMAINLVGCGKSNKKDETVNAFKVIWEDENNLEQINIPYEPIKYEANVKEYIVASDLSNVENIDRISGFSKKQKQSLVQNGFVVVPSTNTQMYNTYEQNEYEYIPSFITSDVVLHLYHQLFSFSLKYTEKNYLINELKTLSSRMLKKSIYLYDETDKMKEYAKNNVAYFLVANMIINDGIVTSEVPEEILAKAKEEYELINSDNVFFEKSPIYGFDMDYSQFRPRGHYTSDENLAKYFRAMMWYGTMKMPLININEEGKIVEENWDDTLQAMLMTYTTFLEYEDKNDVDTFEKIYMPTKFLVGESDDLTIFNYAWLIQEVYGDNPNIDEFDNNKAKDKILELYEELPEPQIVAKFTTVDTPVEKQFRFMGQRYTLDSQVIQNLMEPIVRPVPTGLDVAGVLGNEQAEELIFNELKPQNNWPEYTEEYEKLKNKVESISDKTWMSTAYNGWLWSIKSVLNFNKKGMPFFMQNKAWDNKSINTALGSYAELKHDTVLYSKQAAAEMGGPLEYYDEHYVEPNIELYSKLKWLSEYTFENLSSQNMLDTNSKKLFDDYNNFLTLLINCTLKELNNEPLSEDEKSQLNNIGGYMENLIWQIDSLVNDHSDNLSSAMITDVATIADTGFLQIGTGLPADIYVVVPVEGKLYLTRGSVYTYHEFLNSGQRLTDDEWNKMLGITKQSDDYGYEWYYYNKDNVTKPEQPFWVNSYQPDNNSEIIIETLEIDWENLNE